MTVSEFIDGYNKAQDKEKYCSKHVTNKYVHYSIKLTDCEDIAKTSCYSSIGDSDEKEFRKNSPLCYFLFVMKLIQRYTDIVFGEDAFEEFNSLNECDSVEDIIAAIPQKETSRYKTLLDMYIDDICDYEMSLVSYIDRKGKALDIAIAPLLEDIVAKLEQQQTNK